MLIGSPKKGRDYTTSACAGVTRAAESPRMGTALASSRIDSLPYFVDIDPIAFSLGPVQVHWYGIMTAEER